MMPFLFLVAASANLEALDEAVARCDRQAANPVFAAETARRSQFLLDTYREEEEIVTDRLALADQRRTQRETGSAKPADQKQMDLQQAALDDRQHALNDRRMLEAIRQDATDNMRHYFLSNCPIGSSERSK